MKAINKGLVIGLLGLTLSTANADILSASQSMGVSFIENQTLEYNVNQTLSNYFPKGSFNSVAYDNKILLIGQIPTVEQKAAAYQKTKDLPSVTTVWNYLEVQPKIDVKQASKDAYITTATKSRIFVQKKVNTKNVKVVTENGTVYLLGSSVGNRTQLQGAINGIKSIDGVKGVVDLTQHD